MKTNQCSLITGFLLCLVVFSWPLAHGQVTADGRLVLGDGSNGSCFPPITPQAVQDVNDMLGMNCIKSPEAEAKVDNIVIYDDTSGYHYLFKKNGDQVGECIQSGKGTIGAAGHGKGKNKTNAGFYITAEHDGKRYGPGNAIKLLGLQPRLNDEADDTGKIFHMSVGKTAGCYGLQPGTFGGNPSLGGGTQPIDTCTNPPCFYNTLADDKKFGDLFYGYFKNKDNSAGWLGNCSDFSQPGGTGSSGGSRTSKKRTAN